ncbi:hypothetical protein HHI36_010517, partial [Cryptolaemus montrouzieri]
NIMIRKYTRQTRRDQTLKATSVRTAREVLLSYRSIDSQSRYLCRLRSTATSVFKGARGTTSAKSHISIRYLLRVTAERSMEVGNGFAPNLYGTIPTSWIANQTAAATWLTLFLK